jgi:hypothetical protein
MTRELQVGDLLIVALSNRGNGGYVGIDRGGQDGMSGRCEGSRFRVASEEQSECSECLGTGNWTGWSGDDEYTQEGGCPSCEGTGQMQAQVGQVREEGGGVKTLSGEEKARRLRELIGAVAALSEQFHLEPLTTEEGQLAALTVVQVFDEYRDLFLELAETDRSGA